MSRDVCHITEGGVVQAQKLQRPFQLLERIDAALARLNAKREKKKNWLIVHLKDKDNIFSTIQRSP